MVLTFVRVTGHIGIRSFLYRNFLSLGSGSIHDLTELLTVDLLAIQQDCDHFLHLIPILAEYALGITAATLNDSMNLAVNLVSQGLPEASLIPLGIFDYLTGFDPEAGDVNREPDGERNRVIIAGNLSPEKCVYLTDLGKVNGVRFNLYGVGYEDLGQENVTYMGSFLPDELVGELRGDFGLVWDGTSIETCSGNFGNYLRLNDPHKLSLYLTAGIPVVVWEEAAVADFVKREQVGVTVASLNELGRKLSALTASEYEDMRQNALRISRLTRSGHYLTTAIMKGQQ